MAALEDVADAATRAVERGTFAECENSPECRETNLDAADVLTESQWCNACRADHEIRTALTTVERVRAATGL